MNSKLEKFLNPQKYREKKVKDFLDKVKHVTFKKFNGKTDDDCIKYIYGDGNRYVKGISEIVYNILCDELKKSHNIDKAVKNKNASYKYLSEIKDACYNLYTINKSSGLEEGIEKCKKLQQAFDQASRFSDTAKISFLSHKEVKEYMKKQSKNLKDSINAMEEIFFNT